MKVLLIDNYDSFTYNLVHYLEKSGAEVVVYRNDAAELAHLELAQFDGLVLSPGPGLPEDSGQLMSLHSAKLWPTSYFGCLFGYAGTCFTHWWPFVQ